MSKRRVRNISGMGISKITLAHENQKLQRHQDLSHYKETFFQCGKCGTCRTVYKDANWSRVCPSGEFGKFEAYYLGGKNLLTWALSTDKLKWSENLAKIFYQCSVCMACVQQCQIPEIHTYAGEWLMAMREEAVKAGYGPMPEQTKYTDHIMTEKNPYMEKNESRLKWLPSHIKQSPEAKLAYFVGCTASYREQNIAIATAEILNSLGIEFKILEKEGCCGSPVYMTGQTEKAIELAEMNVESFKESGIEKIITSCAGCYRTLKETYPNKFNLDHGIEIRHLPEFIKRESKSRENIFTNEVNMKITYHDPCHLGRHMGMYNAPRDVLQSIPGIELVEMTRNRHNAWCCGSGGGVRSAFKDLSSFAAKERIEEAMETQAEAIVSSCPFCLNQFKSNIENDAIQTYDISELIRKAV
ncbi:MAG: (Fe-S)-binding protein [Candidatus Lokiarchaeota archaeon]|nr:(Fe-S)-binding protein [Candidatus Lokiarchaeota archaeon]